MENFQQRYRLGVPVTDTSLACSLEANFNVINQLLLRGSKKLQFLQGFYGLHSNGPTTAT